MSLRIVTKNINRFDRKFQSCYDTFSASTSPTSPVSLIFFLILLQHVGISSSKFIYFSSKVDIIHQRFFLR